MRIPRRTAARAHFVFINKGAGHRRTGRGARGAAAPPKFGQLRFFGQQEEIWAKPVFKDVSMFLLLSHDEFLVIREGYHMLVFFVGHCTSLY